MRWGNLTGGRGTCLCLLLVATAIVPGVRQKFPVDSLRPSAALPSAAPSRAPETVPAAVPDPGPVPALPGQLILGELSNRAAPVPVGPTTYVPILLYHYIRINPNPADRVGYNLSTPPELFAAQMRYLADHSFHVLSLHQAVEAIALHQRLPARPLVLTFDDGYTDFFTAAVPLLRAHGFTATDFVITGRMGAFGFMTASQVQAADGMGFTIGAHTVDHYALASLAPARASWEMRQSKLALESLLGHRVIEFAYPYGSYNAYDTIEARRLGFESAASTLSGTVHTTGQLMFLSRVRIGGQMSLSTYARLVGGPPPSAVDTAAGAIPSPTPTPRPTPGPTPTPAPASTPTVLPTPTPFRAAGLAP